MISRVAIGGRSGGWESIGMLRVCGESGSIIPRAAERLVEEGILALVAACEWDSGPLVRVTQAYRTAGATPAPAAPLSVSESLIEQDRRDHSRSLAHGRDLRNTIRIDVQRNLY